MRDTSRSYYLFDGLGTTLPNNAYAPKSYTSPQGNSTTYTYNAAGNLATVNCALPAL